MPINKDIYILGVESNPRIQALINSFLDLTETPLDDPSSEKSVSVVTQGDKKKYTVGIRHPNEGTKLDTVLSRAHFQSLSALFLCIDLNDQDSIKKLIDYFPQVDSYINGGIPFVLININPEKAPLSDDVQRLINSVKTAMYPMMASYDINEITRLTAGGILADVIQKLANNTPVMCEKTYLQQRIVNIIRGQRSVNSITYQSSIDKADKREKEIGVIELKDKHEQIDLPDLKRINTLLSLENLGFQVRLHHTESHGILRKRTYHYILAPTTNDNALAVNQNNNNNSATQMTEASNSTIQFGDASYSITQAKTVRELKKQVYGENDYLIKNTLWYAGSTLLANDDVVANTPLATPGTSLAAIAPRSESKKPVAEIFSKKTNNKAESVSSTFTQLFDSHRKKANLLPSLNKEFLYNPQEPSIQKNGLIPLIEDLSGENNQEKMAMITARINDSRWTDEEKNTYLLDAIFYIFDKSPVSENHYYLGKNEMITFSDDQLFLIMAFIEVLDPEYLNHTHPYYLSYIDTEQPLIELAIRKKAPAEIVISLIKKNVDITKPSFKNEHTHTAIVPLALLLQCLGSFENIENHLKVITYLVENNTVDWEKRLHKNSLSTCGEHLKKIYNALNTAESYPSLDKAIRATFLEAVENMLERNTVVLFEKKKNKIAHSTNSSLFYPEANNNNNDNSSPVAETPNPGESHRKPN